ncbi:hypothetical protein PM082_022263 [Marasmius tenuissimus]|nr:hypothetical protein PM082_022263 [Marasmius tenuissimus]
MSVPTRSRHRLAARMTTGGRAPRKTLKDASVNHPTPPRQDTVIYVSSDEDDSVEWQRSSIRPKKRRSTHDVEQNLRRVKRVIGDQFESLEHGFKAILQRDEHLKDHLTCGICDEIFKAPHV